MKKRNIIAVFSALACLALLPIAQAAPAPETPDPGKVSGSLNTADGQSALQAVTSGIANSAFGAFSQFNLTTGNFNTGCGAGALDLNNGTQNTAVGAAALLLNTTGFNNTAVGSAAMLNNVDAELNTVVGAGAGQNIVTAGFGGNIYIGAGAGGTGDEVAFIRIGTPTILGFPYDTFIHGIFGRAAALATAQFVFVDATGKLGTVLVDAVGNKVATPQAMLDKIGNQQKRVAELEGTVERLTAMVKDQAAQLQKVSAQLEMVKPAPKVVDNKP